MEAARETNAVPNLPDAVGPNDPCSTADPAEARRARKRLTDRKSQRHLRERQRTYIKQLEETVQSYQKSCAQSGNINAAALAEENERLRLRCRNLESLLSRIRNLTGVLDDDDLDAAQPRPEMPMPEVAVPACGTRAGESPPRAVVGSGFGQPFPHAAVAGSIDNAGKNDWRVDTDSDNRYRLPRHGELADPSASDTSVDMMPPAFVPELNYASFLGDGVLPDCSENDMSVATTDVAMSGPSHAGLGMTQDHHQQRAHGGKTVFPEHNSAQDSSRSTDDLQGCLTSLMNGSSVMNLGLVPSSLPMRDPLLADLASGVQNYQHQSMNPAQHGDTGSMHLRYPKTSQKGSDWDRILLDIIDEARMQHQIGHFPTGTPSLSAVLSEGSSDVLASRLYHLICEPGKIPLHTLLSVFWVQYLFLRWHVIGTKAAYLQMPTFMRPTELETRIPHRRCIGMILWHYISIELLRHMINDKGWSPTAHVTGSLIGSTDVLGIIQHQACQPDMWKIDPSFLKKFPQFADCDLR
ncbi:hypothetical protein ColLi_09332 [Colletotrichum liriopes]|uniref:BZIP transcription factor n=1 Tax=Colletotrichum liriopes TaxID=708192 RepID=A0AA37GTG7_9PEZI|nr:hypothetical protein ColLi_09332 [Colletotrichum liriopes]